ncbi:hypothetical protein PVAP13_2NG282000 [Panicum virgatum]|uniref:Uncharacterized protein n=1 Tax=Panicum virgatum TaxID=38727 RepID=A0A8T0VEJ4_PANVG|nr:hypothetical protein PVAP13_2NG282000 [Panicum virgatum]
MMLLPLRWVRQQVALAPLPVPGISPHLPPVLPSPDQPTRRRAPSAHQHDGRREEGGVKHPAQWSEHEGRRAARRAPARQPERDGGGRRDTPRAAAGVRGKEVRTACPCAAARARREEGRAADPARRPERRGGGQHGEPLRGGRSEKGRRRAGCRCEVGRGG